MAIPAGIPTFLQQNRASTGIVTMRIRISGTEGAAL